MAVLRQHCIHTAQQDAIQSNRKTVCQDCVSIASILHDRMLSSATGSLFGSIASGLYPATAIAGAAPLPHLGPALSVCCIVYAIVADFDVFANPLSYAIYVYLKTFLELPCLKDHLAENRMSKFQIVRLL